jgi:murein DD-endopeptidase MepM/ murein hydrolase activator NlpD
MAVNTDPLRRDRIAVVSQDTGDRYSAGRTNAALQLSDSLKELTPEFNQALANIADKEATKQREQGRLDALRNQGAPLANAVRDGKIDATQNPWYMEAYAKEGAALRGQADLQKLQMDSTTWAEQGDPEAFTARWRKEVGDLAGNYRSKDEASAFMAVESQTTQQVLQSNVAVNVQRIKAERYQNVTSIAASALIQASSANGGKLTPQAAILTLQPSKEMWIATGGTMADWNAIQTKAITTASYSTRNSGLLDLTKGIGVDGTAVLDVPFGNGTAEIAPFVPRQLPTSLEGPGAAPAYGGSPGGRKPPVAAAVGHPLGNVKAVTVSGGNYGDRRAKGVHDGLDLAAPVGTPVLAPGAGKVVGVLSAADGNDAGNRVFIDHGGGITTSYAHLAGFNVKVGDIVVPGQQLGTIGMTGRTTGPHLHWVARLHKTTIDPRSVKFPTEYVPFAGSTSKLAQQVSTPPPPPPAPEPTTLEGKFDATFGGGPAPALADVAAPQAVPVARGPSLYDVAGVAGDVAADQYRVNQAQSDAITAGLKDRQARVQVRASQATDYLYQKYGTSILLGNYDVSRLTQELTAQGFLPQEIAQTFNSLKGDTGDVAGLMNNRMVLNANDPTRAKSLFDLALEGRTSGYSPQYEQKVGDAILRGDISYNDGESMVAGALAKTDKDQAEAKADVREARADDRYQRQEDRSLGVVRDTRGLLESLDGLAKLGARSAAAAKGKPVDIRVERRLRQAAGEASYGWLRAHPGDYKGARDAAENVIDSLLQRVTAQEQPSSPAAPAGANPMRSSGQ